MKFVYEEALIFLLVFLRIGGILLILPLFRSGGQALKRANFAFVFTIALIVYPNIPKDYSFISNLNIYSYFFLCAKEILLGVILSYFISLIITSIQTAAQIYSVDMGFGMLNVFDSLAQFQMPVLGNFKYLFFLTLIFIMGVHRKLIFLLIDTFYKYKVAYITYNVSNLSKYSIEMFTYYFIIAVKMSLPVLGILFVMNLVLGIMARIAPQMNVFFIGMPLKIIVGFIVLISISPYFISFMKYMLEDGYIRILKLIEIGLE